MGLIPEWIKRGPGDGGQSTNSQAMAQTHQSQPATQSIAGPTMANIAAAGGSRSDTQQVNLNPGPIDATSEIIVQGGSDDVFKHNAELQYKIQELQRQLAAKWNSSALETNALRSEVDKLTKELKEAKAVNKDNLHLYRNHMTQMQEKLNLQMQTIQQQDQDIDFLQTNIDMLEHNHNIELLDSNSGLEHNAQLVSSLKEQLNNATAKNRSLEDSLEECKERIFKLQPFEAKSDTDIASIYETLCDNISAWVADMFDAFGETGEMSNGMAALVADSELRKTEPSALGNGMVLLVKAHPVTDEVVLSSLIIRLLYRKVFGTKDLCFGLDTSTQNFLLRIMKEFSHLEPSKGKQFLPFSLAELTMHRPRDDRNVACRHLSCPQCHTTHQEEARRPQGRLCHQASRLSRSDCSWQYGQSWCGRLPTRCGRIDKSCS